MAITYAHVYLKMMHIISGRPQKDREKRADNYELS